MNPRLIECAHKAGLETKIEGAIPSASLQQAGIDSLDFYALIMEIQDEIGREINDDELLEVQSIADLEHFFQ